MKKFLTVVLVITAIIGLISLSACSDGDTAEYVIVAPDGAPALAIANLPSAIKADGESGKLTKRIVSSSNISTEALKDDVDMAIVPANLAAKICNTNSKYKILATVTNGNLYMTSSISAEVNELNDLVGSIIYSIGQSSVPDMIFKSLIKRENIPYEIGETPVEGKVVIKYCLDGSDVISQLALAKSKNQLAFGIYGEPAISKSKAKGFEEVLDLQSLWSNANGEDTIGYAQAVLIAKDSVYTNNKLTDKILQEFKNNEETLLQNPSKSVENIKAVYPSTSLQSDMTAQIIERCNIRTVPAVGEGRRYLENTLQVIMGQNANAIGGKLPGDDSYLQA